MMLDFATAARTRLSQQLPGVRVLGAAQLALAVQQGQFQDALYVVPLAERTGPNRFGLGALDQLVETRCAVVHFVRDAADPLGGKLTDSLAARRSAVAEALLNWTPPDFERPVEYGGGSLADSASPFVAWADEFDSAYALRITGAIP